MSACLETEHACEEGEKNTHSSNSIEHESPSANDLNQEYLRERRKREREREREKGGGGGGWRGELL